MPFFASPNALHTFRYTDIDQYRQSVRALHAEFIPLARVISAEQKILRLPGCDIHMIRSFPRIFDAAVVPGCTVIGFAMDDVAPLRINGVDVDRPMVAMGHGGSDFRSVDAYLTRFVSIVFTPEIHDRGWPEDGRHFSTYMTNGSAQRNLRNLAERILEFAANTDDAMLIPSAAAGIRESLLSAIDQAFSAMPQPDRNGNIDRYLKIIDRIDAAFFEDPTIPIYSSVLAHRIGVSVRTMHSAVMLYRGMSLHRYLRVKRLGLVRKRLLAGGLSVKACALAYGFWHLGDFSRIYRTQFGESPSGTLAAAR